MSSNDMFTREEAFAFLKNNLKVKDAEQRIHCDRKQLLDDFIISMQTELPFQNLKLLSSNPESRVRPSFAEIKADLSAGIGGLCFNINLSSYFLLKAIGFDCVMVHATCTSSILYPDNHVIVHVSNVEKLGDKYLVETAFGFPTFRAICLDFETESPSYIDSFIEFKYVKHEGKILRMHRKGDLIKSETKKNSEDGLHFFMGDWRRFYFSNMEGTTNVEEFLPPFQAVWVDPRASPFLTSYRAIKFPNKKAIMVINNKTLIENERGELEPQEICGGDEGIIQKVLELFPTIPENVARSAMVNLRKSQQ